MKTNILMLIFLIGISFSCRTKNKITTDIKEVVSETKDSKVDSTIVNYSKFTQEESVNHSFQENRSETSGNISIKGSSDTENPFIFHHLVGKDTVQRISIIGNAEYVIDHYFTKTDKQEKEIIREKLDQMIVDSSQIHVLEKRNNTYSLEQKSKTKEISSKGFQAGTWVVFGIAVIILLLIFVIYTYKYFKK